MFKESSGQMHKMWTNIQVSSFYIFTEKTPNEQEPMSNASISATASSTSRQSTLDGNLVNRTVTQGKSWKLTQKVQVKTVGLLI